MSYQYEVRKHKWDFCGSCKAPFVRCKCGNNCCNGTYGEIDGKPCPDCPDAYKKQANETPPIFHPLYIKAKIKQSQKSLDKALQVTKKQKIKRFLFTPQIQFVWYKMLRPFLRGLKGEFYCRWFHSHQFAQLYDCYGRDWLGRKLYLHRPRYCQTCGNRWKTDRKAVNDPTGPTIERFGEQWKAII